MMMKKERQVFALLRKLHFVLAEYQNSTGISPGGEAAVIRKLEDLRGEVLDRIEKKVRDELRSGYEGPSGPPIYRVPCSYTGLSAELDTCESVEIRRVHDTTAPIHAGCAGRYITTDGLVFDCSIDLVDFANWFQLSELDEIE